MVMQNKGAEPRRESINVTYKRCRLHVCDNGPEEKQKLWVAMLLLLLLLMLPTVTMRTTTLTKNAIGYYAVARCASQS